MRKSLVVSEMSYLCSLSQTLWQGKRTFQALSIQTSNEMLKQQTLFFTSLGFIRFDAPSKREGHGQPSKLIALSGLKLNLDPES